MSGFDHDPDDEWCQCGRRESFHSTPECLCSRFERSHSFNGGKVRKVRTGTSKDSYAIVADHS